MSNQQNIPTSDNCEENTPASNLEDHEFHSNYDSNNSYFFAQQQNVIDSHQQLDNYERQTKNFLSNLSPEELTLWQNQSRSHFPASADINYNLSAQRAFVRNLSSSRLAFNTPSILRRPPSNPNITQNISDDRLQTLLCPDNTPNQISISGTENNQNNTNNLININDPQVQTVDSTNVNHSNINVEISSESITNQQNSNFPNNTTTQNTTIQNNVVDLFYLFPYINQLKNNPDISSIIFNKITF